MAEKNELSINPTEDSLRIFLDYIARQLKKNPDYVSHPLITALSLAVAVAKDAEIDKPVMGMSQEGTKDNIYNPFIVVAQKDKNSNIEIKEIRELKVNKIIPAEVMITIFRLQIWLDKIKGKVVSPEQMVNALNSVIPGDNFYFLGDKWQEAREEFVEQLKAGKISIPDTPEMHRIADDLLKTTHNTPWEEYSSSARSLIGSGYKIKAKDNPATMIITTPKQFFIEKYKVFDIATEFMLGKTSDYLNPSKS